MLDCILKEKETRNPYMPDFQYIFSSQSQKYDDLVSEEDHNNNLLNCLEEITSFAQKDIIEFGAGTGRLTFKLCSLARDILAMDISQSMLDIAIKKQKERKITNVKFLQSDNLTLPKSTKEYDIAIEGWSFLAVVAISENKWEEKNYRKIINKLVQNMKTATKKDGSLIIIETLGTFEEKPNVPENFANIYKYLENELGFQNKAIRTDFRFDTVEQAIDLMTFFFGEEYKEMIMKNNMTIIPECTGIWHRKNDKEY
jgi:ubiquinone/menaquinone biosynthesis C-methylase UbiE